MEGLTQVLEKISTLNINANTNIDIQSIVQQYVLFDTIKNVSIALIVGLTILIVVFLIYRFSNKLAEIAKWEKAIVEREKELEKISKRFEEMAGYREFGQMNDKLQEIIDYMPRNKHRRK